ncbi:MAG: hypothetical protein HOO06_05325 [Bdellovibrionaceae bacterium]|jgi:hemerythrin-like domain-containing protein|nr:hypothetical protein [Pseudobdellovibrionaceae bacterium]
MKATEILIKEHIIIKENMRSMKNLIEEGNKINAIQYSEFIQFVRLYADKLHHAKEEDIYFAWMLKHRPQLQMGPIGVMLHEHNLGRNYMSLAEQALETMDTEALNLNILNFITLLNAHIDKENGILYQIAEQIDVQTKDGDEVMMPGFHSVQSELSDIEEKYHKDVTVPSIESFNTGIGCHAG